MDFVQFVAVQRRPCAWTIITQQEKSEGFFVENVILLLVCFVTTLTGFAPQPGIWNGGVDKRGASDKVNKDAAMHLRNLCSSEIFDDPAPWEFTDLAKVPSECIKDKAARDKWVNNPLTRFHVYTLFEGVQKNLRLRAGAG